MTAPSPK